MRTHTHSVTLPLFLSCLLVSGCGGAPGAASGPGAEAPVVSNRIAVPAEVVANIGITFRDAKRGRLETRMVVPGRLVVPPEARWELRSPFAGTIHIKRRVGDRIAKGDVVAEIVSDDLRTLQRTLWADHGAEKSSALEQQHAKVEFAGLEKLARVAEASLVAARVREGRARTLLLNAEALEKTTAARHEELRKLSGGSLGRKELLAAQRAWVEAQALALDARERSDTAQASVVKLEVEAANATVRASTVATALEAIAERVLAARVAYETRLTFLASVSGIPVSDLIKRVDGLHRWARLSSLPLAAPAAGLISDLAASNGEWISAGGPIVEIVDHRELLFEGHLPEIDAARIKAGAAVRISPAVTGIEPTDTTIGRVYPVASATARTITIHARIQNPGGQLPAGVTAMASILLRVSDTEEVLVPAGCVVQDDLETIVFMQDREDPGQVVRLPVSIGRRSDEWVEILTEVDEGDKLVESGIHQLREAGSGKAPSGGHFHADGTWHLEDK